MTEELYIDGQAVDLKPDAATTLNFKSNLLGDISKITASNSQTIQCPKTLRNRKIFDNPGAPAYVSGKRYKRYSARLARNGIEVVRVGYAVLLSASESYEIALYWGVMANFQAWIDKGAKLNELAGTETLAWNKSTTATDLTTMKSQGYGYAQYDCGVSDTELVNIHPSATAWWILNKIATQAGFTFEMPDKYETALRAIAVPCLRKIASPESWVAEKTSVSAYCRTIREFLGMDTGGGALMAYAVGYINVNSSVQTRPIYLGNNVPYGYYANWKWDTSSGMRWPVGTDHTTVYMAEFSTLSLDEMEVYIDALAVNLSDSTSIVMYAKKDGTDYSKSKTWTIAAGRTIREVIDCSGFDKYYFMLEGPMQEAAAYEVNIEITPHAEEITYPSAFRIISNLPDISQIDFIKALCGMLGIFVVSDPTDSKNLKFVSFDVLQTNKGIAHDWSRKLATGNEDEPKTVEFKVGEYARNNFFKYKEDDTVATNGDGNLTIASEVLEKEKTVITLPFAASDGSTIRHYKLNEDGTVEDIQVKDRIMGLINDGSGRALLTFDDMSFDILLLKYYKPLTRLLNSAIATTEAIMLNEVDLKSLDFTIPFYLRQYGKFYGIISLKSTANKACEVKAVQLTETLPDRPAKSAYIGFKYVDSEIFLTSTAALQSDIVVTYEHFIVGIDEPMIEEAVFARGSTEQSLMTVTRQHLRLELVSLTPDYDRMYNYIISK